MLGRRKLWGIYFGHFVWGTVGTFFRSWFPTYLVTYRHFTFIKAGFYVSLPFLAVFAGVLCSGAISDLLVRKGFSLTFARKVPIIGGLICSTSIVGANYVDSQPLIIAFLTFAFFCNGVASIHWSLVSATAPERLIGLASSVFNFMGGLAGILSPIVVGFLLRAGDFRLPLTFIAVIEALGRLLLHLCRWPIGTCSRIVERHQIFTSPILAPGGHAWQFPHRNWRCKAFRQVSVRTCQNKRRKTQEYEPSRGNHWTRHHRIQHHRA